MFHQISKYLEVVLKKTRLRLIFSYYDFFNRLLSVLISDETHLLVFDIHVLRKHKLIELEVLLIHTDFILKHLERQEDNVTIAVTRAWYND